MLGIQLRPQRFGQCLTGVKAAFDRQVDEQGQRLACGEGERALTVLHDWCPKQRHL